MEGNLESQNIIGNQELLLNNKNVQVDHCQVSGNNSGEFLGDLIEKIKNYQCLWDSSSRGFKELPKKQEAWIRIGGKFNVDGKFLSFITFQVIAII